MLSNVSFCSDSTASIFLNICLTSRSKSLASLPPWSMPTWPDKNKKPLAFTPVLKGPAETANLADCIASIFFICMCFFAGNQETDGQRQLCDFYFIVPQ